MEKFQKLIHKAIQNKIYRLIIKANTPVNVVFAGGIQTWNDEIFSEEVILSLFQGFFKKENFEFPEYYEWQIPKFGSIYVLVEKENNNIVLKFYFFEEGYKMFTNAWTQLQSNASIKETAQNIKSIPISSQENINIENTTNHKKAVNSEELSSQVATHDNSTKKEASPTNIFILSPDKMPNNTQKPTKDVPKLQHTTDPNEECTQPDNVSNIATQSKKQKEPKQATNTNINIFAVPISTVETPQNKKDSKEIAATFNKLYPQIQQEQIAQVSSSPKEEITPNTNDNDNVKNNNIVHETNKVTSSTEKKINNEVSEYTPNNNLNLLHENTNQLLYFGTLPSEKVLSTKNNIDELLMLMIKNHASDMHLKIGSHIFLRIDEKIQKINSDILNTKMMENYFSPIIPDINKKELIQNHNTYFCYQLGNVGRFRIQLYRDITGIGAVIRYIPLKILSLEELSLPNIISTYCQFSSGLVLLSGPSRGGKTTTLAAMINWLNENKPLKITCIEDPIEYIHIDKNSIISQKEVKKHCKDFVDALKSSFKEDVDVVVISELKDPQTIELALELAETGHLVFGIVNANSVINTIERLIDYLPAEKQDQARLKLGDTLKGIITQTLVKKLNGGLIPALELLKVTLGMSAIIKEGKTHMLINQIQSGKADGNILLNEYLLQLVKSQQISAQEAYFKSVNKKEFKDILNANNIEL